MSTDVLRSRVALVQRACGAGLVLRLLIVIGPIAAITCTRIAGHAGFLAADMVLFDALVIVLAITCVVSPDGHLGVVVLALLTAEWLAVVDDPATPWSLGMAAAFTVFHTSLAAACVAPPSARWTPAMWHRWLRRAVVLLVASAGTTLAVIAAHHLHMSGNGNGIVLTAALTTLAVGGLWAATGPGRPRPTSGPARKV